MRKNLAPTVLSVSFVLAACNGGGGASNSVSPYPYQTAGTYNGVPYSQLGNPPGFTDYPEAYFPTFVSTTSMGSTKIAYGRNNESDIANLTAYLRMGKYICSATPVYYNPIQNTTFFVGAAHCFVPAKPLVDTLTANDLVSNSLVSVYNGISKDDGWYESFPATAVYMMKNYCYGATFDKPGGCPNFTSSDGVAGGEGNDLAIIQISGKYANPESYPSVVPESQYPTELSMAPVLSIGYGLNTQNPTTPDSDLPRSVMFYVANYFYNQVDTAGYHYLYNSFFNSASNGYAALICGGDSGGGDLFWTGQKWILLSEHTYGPDDACGTYYNYLPNAATNVGVYYNWIESIITSTSPQDWCNATANNCVTNYGL